MRYGSVVIKIGTNVLTKEDGSLNIAVIQSLTRQVADLQRKKIKVVMVSSGAMAAGRGILQPKKSMKGVAGRQVLAAVGQVELIHTYAVHLKKEGLHCAQVLATKDDFRSRKHYLNMRSCMESLSAEGIIPIVNENDVVSVEELMFTDNDELAGLIATMLNADALIILSSIDGLQKDDGEVIAQIAPGQRDWKQYLRVTLSQFGRGGMHTKCETAQKLALVGIETVIARGTRDGIVADIIEGKSVGTRFLPKENVSSTKRWVGTSAGAAKASVYLHPLACEKLRDEHAAISLLPVGITKVDGDFSKGDVVHLCDAKGNHIGLGMAAYDSEQARSNMGKKGARPLVRYEYLYFFHA